MTKPKRAYQEDSRQDFDLLYLELKENDLLTSESQDFSSKESVCSTIEAYE